MGLIVIRAGSRQGLEGAWPAQVNTVTPQTKSPTKYIFHIFLSYLIPVSSTPLPSEANELC